MEGGWATPFFKCVYFSVYLTQQKEASNLQSEGLRNTLWESTNPYFPWVACPQTLLDDYSLLCLMPEPPHFCRAFSALVEGCFPVFLCVCMYVSMFMCMYVFWCFSNCNGQWGFCTPLHQCFHLHVSSKCVVEGVICINCRHHVCKYECSGKGSSLYRPQVDLTTLYQVWPTSLPLSDMAAWYCSSPLTAHAHIQLHVIMLSLSCRWC